jgi:maltooligosyltrehalose trehalohydrolase
VRLGAVPATAGTDLCVWAPNAERVTVRGQALERVGDGFFAATLALRPGDDYELTLHGARPCDETVTAEPCSREQPEGLHGPSRVLDTGRFEWQAGPVAVPLDELVIYELHVGTFTPEGTFQAAIVRLDELVELGITAIELMPVATFPGERGWGYDGVLLYAPHRTYGGPHGLAGFVDAAHVRGLAVILDVVYNHVGPGAELAQLGPYFTDRHDTFWGDALDYSQRGVREWAIQNAELWVRDYRIDGLRLDATHAIFDDSRPHIMRELAERVRAAHPGALVIAEMAIGDRRPLAEWGHDAQWADEFHHALHVLLTGERDGYYADFGSVADLARGYQDDGRLVVYDQDHDQVGNRARGDRLPLEARRLAAACVLFAPQIPLLFMGEEYGETAPFQFFTDHDDPYVAESTREGRKEEFASFSGFGGEVPDPQDEATFARSKLHPEAGDPELRRFYAELIALRRTLPRDVDTDVDEQRRVLRVRRGDRELVADFANLTAEIG